MNKIIADESWDSGPNYESYVGRWSRLVACEFLSWLRIPADRRWIDVGCGTGALSQTVLSIASPRYVVGVDASSAFVEYARRQVPSLNACFDVRDARFLPFPSESYDAVVSGLAINFIPQAEVAIGEMARILVPGGTAAAYVWDYGGGMQSLRRFWDVAAEIDPDARSLDEAARFPLCRPGPLKDLFLGAGFEHVQVRAIDVPTHFRDIDDFWSPFLGGQGPAPSYVASLSDERRAVLREHMRAALPIASDGSISLIARAWSVRGTRM